MPQQEAGPGQVPQVVERRPDEAVAEQLLLVVDEPVVCGDGRVIAERRERSTASTSAADTVLSETSSQRVSVVMVLPLFTLRGNHFFTRPL